MLKLLHIFCRVEYFLMRDDHMRLKIDEPDPLPNREPSQLGKWSGTRD